MSISNLNIPNFGLYQLVSDDGLGEFLFKDGRYSEEEILFDDFNDDGVPDAWDFEKFDILKPGWWVLPPIEVRPLTCEAACKAIKGLRRKNCGILRKRVGVALKKAGCPSQIKELKGTRTRKR